MQSSLIKLLLTIFPALISLPIYSLSDALSLKITGTPYSDETIIRYISGASEGFDGKYDAWKLFSNSGKVPSIYTKTDSGYCLAINAMPDLKKNTSVSIYTKINIAGQYTIIPSEIGAFPDEILIVLEDLKTGDLFDLRKGKSYSFYMDKDVNGNKSRFSIHFSFSTKASITIKNPSCNELHGKVTIFKSDTNAWAYTLKNAAGSLTITNHKARVTETLSNIVPGSYELIITSSSGNNDTLPFTVLTTYAKASFIALAESALTPNSEVSFINQSRQASKFYWDFGDGNIDSSSTNAIHVYTSPGNYTVMLTAKNEKCTDEFVYQISILSEEQANTTGIEELSKNFEMYYTENTVVISNNEINGTEGIMVGVYDLLGKQYYEGKMDNSRLTIPALNSGGCFLVRVQMGDKVIVKKFMARI